jgi:hypothetical protein
VIIAALASSMAGCSDGDRAIDAAAAQRAAGVRLYWVGRSFEGLPVTGVSRNAGLTTFVYGTCKPRGDNESCSTPLQIQVDSICDRNALLLDVHPQARFQARGVPVMDYGEWRLELAVGASQVVVFGAPARARRAIAALRAADQEEPGGDLPAPRYPRQACPLEP